MTIDEAARVLLRGLCGPPNILAIAREAGVPRTTVERYLEGRPSLDATLEALYLYLWRQLNATVLLAREDFAAGQVVVVRPAPRPRGRHARRPPSVVTRDECSERIGP